MRLLPKIYDYTYLTTLNTFHACLIIYTNSLLQPFLCHTRATTHCLALSHSHSTLHHRPQTMSFLLQDQPTLYATSDFDYLPLSLLSEFPSKIQCRALMAAAA
eukprot:SAG31_NODE_9566_length_1258_cov_1.303710_1_plen_102_part_10